MPFNTPIPTKSTGNVLGSADWNDLVPVNTTIGLYDIGSPAVGSVAAVNAPNWYVQAGYWASSTNGSGQALFTYPGAFPNGVLSVQLTSADGGLAVLYTVASMSLSTFAMQAIVTNTGSAYISSTFHLNWLAIGC